MASAAEYLKIILASEFKAKGFSDADKAVNKLQKNVKTLAKGFGVAFGAAGLARYSKDAVKAFAADDKAAKLLSKTLENLGMAFADPKVKEFIKNLETQYGILDDVLRPAYQRLVVATGDWKKAQDLLVTSLNVSAGTGKDLDSVTMALSKAYLGNTTALSRLGAGLSKAELASGNFEDITKRLNTIFAGQAQEAADTYAGSLARLNVAAENAKETIGKGLIDALSALGGSGGLSSTISGIDHLSMAIADLVTGIGRLGGAIKTGVGTAFSGQGFLSGWNTQSSIYRQQDIANAQKSDERYRKETWGLTKKQVVLQGQQIKLTKQSNAAQKAALKDKKLAAVFDLDQIQVMAALQGKITQEEKLRLELQLAMLQGNTDEAQRLAEKLAAVQGQTGMLSLYLRTLPDAKNPFASWSDYLKAIEEQLKRISTTSPTAVSSSVINSTASTASAIAAASASTIGSTAWIEAQKQLAASGYYGISGTYTGVETNVQPMYPQGEAYAGGYGGVTTINLNLDGQQIGSVIVDNLQNQTASGVLLGSSRLQPDWNYAV